MRLKLPRGLDPASGGLIVGGASLVASSFVAAVVFLTPAPGSEPATPAPTPIVAEVPAGRPSVALPADRVGTVLFVGAASGAGAATRAGDHVDVLGYFSQKVTGTQNVTRRLLQDVPVLSAARSGATIALTLAVPQDGALLLQEAQAIGARPMITLRSAHSMAGDDNVAPSFSDTELADRLSGTP
jgi:hypothetical protein